MPLAEISLGTAIWCSVKPILKIYLIIATGFVLARKNILSVATSRNLSSLVVNVALPCLVFNKTVSNLSYEDGKSIGVLSFVCFLVMAIGGLLGLLLNYVSPNPRSFYYGLIVAAMFPNMGDLPIAFIQGMPSIIFPAKLVDKGVAYVAIFTFAEMFTFFNLGFMSAIGLDFKSAEKEPSLAPAPSNTSKSSKKMAQVVQEYSENGQQITATDSVMDELSLVRSRVSEPSKSSNSLWETIKSGFVLCITSFKRPTAFLTLLGISVALVPWLKALFSPFKRHVDYPNAPDGNPPLHFVIDTLTYIGNSEVPLGLFLLGATLGRLEVTSISKGLVVSALALAFVKLAVIPIIGVALMTKFKSLGWFNDDMATFMALLNWGLPSMTTQIYITAFFTPLEGPHVQMDCMAIYLLTQYVFLIISFPILITYCLKNTLGY